MPHNQHLIKGKASPQLRYLLAIEILPRLDPGLRLTYLSLRDRIRTARRKVERRSQSPNYPQRQRHPPGF